MTLLSEMLADAPWGLWRAADASGLSAPDASGNGHDGVLSGSGVTIDPFGLHLAEPCFTFDGSGGSITIPGAVDLPAGDYTLVAALTSALSGTRGGVVGYGQWGSTDFTNYLVVEDTTVLHSVWYSNDLDDTVSGLGTGAHLVATRFDGTTRQAWLDAAAVGSGDTPGSPSFDLTQNVLLGLDGGSESYSGKLDYLAIFPTRLSDARLTAYHTALIAVLPNAPTGLTATPNTSTGAIDLAWTAPASGPTPDSYTIERSTTTGAETSYHTGVVGLAYSDTGVVVGTTYYYKVRSVTVAAGDGGLSSEANAIAPVVAARTCMIHLPTLLDGTATPRVGVRHAWRYNTGGRGVLIAGGTAGLSQVSTDLVTDSGGDADIVAIAPGDCDPGDITILITYDADDPNPTEYETTSFAYSAVARTLADVLPALGTLPTVQMIIAERVPDGGAATGSPRVSLNQSSNVSGTNYRLAGNTPVPNMTLDALGNKIVSLVPSSLLDPGTVYLLSDDSTQTLYRRVPDQSEIDSDADLAYLFNPDLEEAATTGSAAFASETGIATSSPGIVYHASPTTLKDDLEMARWRAWVQSWYGPRPPLTYGAGRFYF